MVLALVVTSAALHHSYNRVGNVAVECPETCCFSLIIVSILTCSIVHREDRVGYEHIENIIPIVVADTDTALCAVCISHVLAERDDIEVTLAENHVVRIDTDSSTVVL